MNFSVSKLKKGQDGFPTLNRHQALIKSLYYVEWIRIIVIQETAVAIPSIEFNKIND